MTEPELSEVACVGQHPVTLEDGRNLGPGETAQDVDVSTDYHRDLVADRHIVVVGGPNVKGRRRSQEGSQTPPPEVKAALTEQQES